MKKIIAIALSFLFISLQSVKAEIGVGVTAAAHMFDASGTETTRTSGEINTGSHSETASYSRIIHRSNYRQWSGNRSILYPNKRFGS